MYKTARWLKTLTTVIACIQLVAVVIAMVFEIVLGITNEKPIYIVIGLAIGLFGFLSAALFKLLLTVIADIGINTKRIADTVRNHNDHTQAEAEDKAPARATVWTCSICGQKNYPTAKNCEICGIARYWSEACDDIK